MHSCRRTARCRWFHSLRRCLARSLLPAVRAAWRRLLPHAGRHEPAWGITAVSIRHNHGGAFIQSAASCHAWLALALRAVMQRASAACNNNETTIRSNCDCF
jgi:hypothetical protein